MGMCVHLAAIGAVPAHALAPELRAGSDPTPQSDSYAVGALLYELLSGELRRWEIAPRYDALLAGRGIAWLRDSVVQIDSRSHSLFTASGRELTYSQLVVAAGARLQSFGIPGVIEHAIGFRSLADVERLQQLVALLRQQRQPLQRLVIVGAGPSGVELACKLADHLGERGRVRLVERTDTLLRTSSEYNRQTAQRALSDLGVWIDLETSVAEVTATTISLTFRDQTDILPVDLVLWTVGSQVHPLVAQLPVAHNPRQQLVVESTLALPDRPEVYALGDLADCRDAEGQQMPATAQVAIQQADFVAWNIWASLRDRPQLPFRYRHLGEMLTLGSQRATLTGLGLQLDGPLAHVARRLAYLYRMPTLEHQVRVGLNWMLKPLQRIMTD
jgi:NADH dehydrogenase